MKGGLQGYDAPGSTRVQHACKCSLGGGLQQLRRKRSAHHRGGRNRSGLSGDWPLAGPEQLCTPGSRSSFLLLHSACPGPSASGLRLSQASALLRHCVLRTHWPDQRNHWLASGAIDFHTEYPRLPTASQTAGTCDRFRESLRDWRMRSVARATWHAREDMASPRSSGGASGKEGAHADSSSVGAPGA